MLDYLYDALGAFRHVFSRHQSWLVFVVVVLGFIGSHEMKGVSSLCRFWLMETSGYYTLLHFFRSSAWDLGSLLETWYSWVLSQGHSLYSQERLGGIGDPTYVSKDGRRIPGVVTLHQESESQSKPSYFRGQCWGALALIVGGRLTPFALPLNFQRHQGFRHLGQDSEEDSLTLAERMVQMALDFAWKVQKPVVLTLDAFFQFKAYFDSLNRFIGSP